MYSYGYCPIINKPTRIQGYAATSTDHIYTNYYNSKENELFNGIMFTDISDHLPVFTINKKKAVKPEMSYTFLSPLHTNKH